MLPPDPATMDLAEAPRIVGGGAGLGGAGAASCCSSDVAVALGASHRRHPGRRPTRAGSATSARSAPPAWSSTRGCTSRSASRGAVQHISGLGDPDHIVAVNTDPHCPMMALADLAIVADANAVLDELADRSAAGRVAADADGAMPDFDVDRRRRRPGRVVRRARAGPRRHARSCCSSAARSPASKNMYGGVVYAPHPRHAASRAGGRRRRSSAGSPAAPRWCSPTRRRSPSTTAPTALGRAAVQRRHRLPARLRRVAGRQGRGRRRRARLRPPPPPGCCATSAGASSACAPTGPTATSTRPRRDRLRRRQLVPRQGGRALPATSTRRTSRSA